jgi:hypothetical protein
MPKFWIFLCQRWLGLGHQQSWSWWNALGKSSWSVCTDLRTHILRYDAHPYVHSIGNCIFPIVTVPITQRYVGRLSVARYRPMRGGGGGERSPFFPI